MRFRGSELGAGLICRHLSVQMLLVLCLLAWGGGFVRAQERQKQCRSVHLWYHAVDGVAFYNEVTVKQSAPGAYFMVCGWDKGYYGIQERGDGAKRILFSVWDSRQKDPKAVPEETRVKLISKDDRVQIGRFGGEGTGGQSYLSYDWKIGETYRFLVTARVNGERTEYSGFFYMPEEKAWTRLVTFSTITGGKSLRGYYSFVEDFKRDGISATKVREASYGNGWVRNLSGQWAALTQARFTADSNPAMNINAGTDGERFFLATGGETRNVNAKLREVMNLSDTQKRTPPEGLPSGDNLSKDAGGK